MVVEVPARELAGRDPARARVGEAEEPLPASGRVLWNTELWTTSRSRVVMLKNVKPCSTATGIQRSGFVTCHSAYEHAPTMAN